MPCLSVWSVCPHPQTPTIPISHSLPPGTHYGTLHPDCDYSITRIVLMFILNPKVYTNVNIVSVLEFVRQVRALYIVVVVVYCTLVILI